MNDFTQIYELYVKIFINILAYNKRIDPYLSILHKSYQLQLYINYSLFYRIIDEHKMHSYHVTLHQKN